MNESATQQVQTQEEAAQNAVEVIVDTSDSGVETTIDARVLSAANAALDAAESDQDQTKIDEDKLKAAMAVNSRSTR